MNAGDRNDSVTVGDLSNPHDINFAVIIDGGGGDDYLVASAANFNVTPMGGTGSDGCWRAGILST